MTPTFFIALLTPKAISRVFIRFKFLVKFKSNIEAKNIGKILPTTHKFQRDSM